MIKYWKKFWVQYEIKFSIPQNLVWNQTWGTRTKNKHSNVSDLHVSTFWAQDSTPYISYISLNHNMGRHAYLLNLTLQHTLKTPEVSWQTTKKFARWRLKDLRKYQCYAHTNLLKYARCKRIIHAILVNFSRNAFLIPRNSQTPAQFENQKNWPLHIKLLQS